MSKLDGAPVLAWADGTVQAAPRLTARPAQAARSMGRGCSSWQEPSPPARRSPCRGRPRRPPCGCADGH
jgi:hypothetical protein